MTSRILLITGANTGLGLETVKALYNTASQQYTILLGGRSIDKAKSAAESVTKGSNSSKSEIVPVQIDITKDDSIQALHEHVKEKYGKLDVLINNGGLQLDPQIRAGNVSLRQGWQEQFDVNVTSTHVMTHSFADLLLKSQEPRLIFIASGTSSLEEASKGLPKMGPKSEPGWPKQIGGLPGYRSSKAATNMMMLEWKRIFEQDHVKVFAVSPGMLATGLGGIGPEQLRKMGAIEPSIGAGFIRDVVNGERDHDEGKVIRKDNVQPW